MHVKREKRITGKPCCFLPTALYDKRTWFWPLRHCEVHETKLSSCTYIQWSFQKPWQIINSRERVWRGQARILTDSNFPENKHIWKQQLLATVCQKTTHSPPPSTLTKFTYDTNPMLKNLYRTWFQVKKKWNFTEKNLLWNLVAFQGAVTPKCSLSVVLEICVQVCVVQNTKGYAEIAHPTPKFHFENGKSLSETSHAHSFIYPDSCEGANWFNNLFRHW